MNFDEIIKTQKQNVKNIITLITKQDNEDLEQEVFVKVYKNIDKYEEKGNFKSWVLTIARNVAKDYLKSASFKNSKNTDSDDYTLETVKDYKISPEDNVINLDRRKRIINAIDNLKPKMKEVILLCEVYGLSYEEASIKLHCPIGTIKSRIFNAKKELAIVLNDLL